MIYFDHAAMTNPLPCALEAYRTAPFGNPSSEHHIGMVARNTLEGARFTIAMIMGCEPDEIVFTSTATEAASLALYSLAQEDYQIYPSPFEHHAVSENINEIRFGATASAVMYANNEAGEIYSVPKEEMGSVWLCDATAAVGHVPIHFRNLGCDYLIADGIKFGGVPGAAFLVAKNGVPLYPLIRGGGQERGMRAGTENLPAICAMATALEWQTEHMRENTEMVSALRELLVNKLSQIPGRKWNTPFEKPCLPHILNVSFDGVDGKALAMILSREGIMVSTGAACSNGLNEPSHVLMAMYGDEARARGAIRISLSHQNTIDECAIAAKKIEEAVAHLRSVDA